MIAAKSPEWPQAIADLAVSTDYDAAAMLGQTGEAIAGQLRESIVNLTEPPLAPAYGRRKGSEKPLIPAICWLGLRGRMMVWWLIRPIIAGLAIMGLERISERQIAAGSARPRMRW